MDAHVIPGKVLFANPTPENRMYETSAFTDSSKVVVSFTPEIYVNATKKRKPRPVRFLTEMVPRAICTVDE